MGKDSGSPTMQVSSYYMSMHMGICLGPVDALLAIYASEKTAWEGSATTEQTIAINQPSLFGGNKKEGGLQGDVRFMPGGTPGTVTMLQNLAARLGKTAETCPAFAGIANLFFVGSVADTTSAFLWGMNNPYIKPVWAKVRRRSNSFVAKPGEPSNYSDMGSESNPAHMIYECLTNTEWGMGASPSIIDVTSFQDCAKTFFDEDFGLSMIWTQQASIESFIGEIIDHVQATLFVNPLTGLLTLKAIRDDYDPEDLAVLDTTNCRIVDFQRKLWGETINEINVTWTNPVNEKEETVTLHDLANVEMQGGIVSDTRNYYGVRTVDLAMAIAARDIRTAAAPLASFDIEADRTMWGVLPGGVVKLNYPEYGIEGLILRIGNVDYGKPGDSKIRFSALEDIFGLPQTAYTVPTETGWESEAQDPSDAEYVQIMTLPTYFAAQVLGQSGALAPEYPEVLAGILVATENRDTRSYDLFGEVVQPNGELGMSLLGTKPVLARSTLQAALDAEASTTTNGDDLGIPGMTVGNPPLDSGFIIFGEGGDTDTEIAMISSATATYSSITIERGVLDTVPRAWPAGTPVWYIENGIVFGNGTIFADGSDATFQVCPSTSKGTLDIADASEHVETLTGRPHFPARPANVQIEGQGFGVIFTSTGDFDVTWANRNRLTEDSQVVLWEDGDITAEVGQTTTVTVMDMDRNILTVHDDLTGTSFTLPGASFDGGNVGIVRVTAKRDGHESIQGHEIVVSFGTGYGTDYGNNYGSIS